MSNLALPAPKPDVVYIALRSGKFHLPEEPSFKALPMTLILGVYREQAKAEEVAATCKPGPGWIGAVQYTDIAEIDAPANNWI